MNIGRPRRPESKKKSEKIFVNMTKKQKYLLSEYAEENNMSLSQVCIKALKQMGYIQ